jgi:D-xylose transport system permease protein
MAGIATIAIGVVFVLLLGEIDLSIGFVSAVGGVVMTLIFRDLGWPWFSDDPSCAGRRDRSRAGAGVDHHRLWAALFYRDPGGPAGLERGRADSGGGWRHNHLAGQHGDRDRQCLSSGQLGLGLAAAIVLVYAGSSCKATWRRRREGPDHPPACPCSCWQIVGVAALILAGVYVSNLDRGVPVVGVLLALLLVVFSFVATRTPFGRYVDAVGGSAEAARRARDSGQPHPHLRLHALQLHGWLGRDHPGPRLRSVATNSGGGNLVLNCIAAAVIGGTSLFGGHGFVLSALLGVLVVGSVENEWGCSD